MIKRSTILIGFLGVILISTGCAAPSRLAMDYGTSAKLVKFNQILNPEAERNLAPVTGLDGKAAQTVIDKYEKGFEKDQPPTFTPIFGIKAQ